MKIIQAGFQFLFPFLILFLALLGARPASAAPAIEGIYKMTVKIGDKLFTDLVMLSEPAPGKLAGSVTLPTVFTAPLEGSYEYNKKNKSGSIKFTISTLERGKKLEVLYEGKISKEKHSGRFEFKGYATDLSENKVFGEIFATSLKEVAGAN